MNVCIYRDKSLKLRAQWCKYRYTKPNEYIKIHKINLKRKKKRQADQSRIFIIGETANGKRRQNINIHMCSAVGQITVH